MNLFGIRTERIHIQRQKCPLGELMFEELEGHMMPWRTYIVCLVVLLLGPCEGAPGPGECHGSSRIISCVRKSLVLLQVNRN